VNPDLAALLVVQQHDDTLREIGARRDALAPRLAAMQKARQRAVEEVARHDLALAKESERKRALDARMSEHRQRLEKNTAVLDQAHKVKEATAAMAQVETARRVLAEDESEALAMSRRLADLRTGLAAAQETLATIDAEQLTARQAVEADRLRIGEELAAAQAQRAQSSGAVSPGLLSRYDRVQSRRQGPALFALNAGFSCGSCDTAIPLQRRPAMSSGHTIEVCEGCGVLLYLPVAPASS
jgi:predicted  nucleic acid-binding Zn-ribbon protein